MSLHIREGTRPIFHPAYSVPLRLKGTIVECLDKMVHEGILERVTESDWASPMVSVRKPDNTYRLCIDPSKTVNPVLTNVFYPLPKIDSLLAEVAGHQFYAKLDLAKAYQQFEIHTDSRELLVVNTVKGLFRYCRLPFGIKTAASIFQREVDG